MTSGRVAFLLVCCGVVFGIYMLLAESLDLPEIAVGLGSSVVAMIGVEAVARHSRERFSFDPRWFARALSIPRRIVSDSAIVLASLSRKKSRYGRFREVSIRGKGRHQSSAAWRALTITDVSVAPNTYAVTVKRAEGEMVVHQLVETDAGKESIP